MKEVSIIISIIIISPYNVLGKLGTNSYMNEGGILLFEVHLFPRRFLKKFTLMKVKMMKIIMIIMS